MNKHGKWYGQNEDTDSFSQNSDTNSILFAVSQESTFSTYSLWHLWFYIEKLNLLVCKLNYEMQAFCFCEEESLANTQLGQKMIGCCRRTKVDESTATEEPEKKSRLTVRQPTENRVLWLVITFKIQMNKRPLNFRKPLDLYLQGLSYGMSFFQG